jgi:hypothetical protein
LDVLYFGYCTFLNRAELERYLPGSEVVAQAYAANHKLEFRGSVTRDDRGWCHLEGGPSGHGHRTYGIVVRHPSEQFATDHPGFERVFLTVYGTDGETYDCWTYVMSEPGDHVRPPDDYWADVPLGLEQWDFPPEYVHTVMETYRSARPSRPTTSPDARS